MDGWNQDLESPQPSELGSASSDSAVVNGPSAAEEFALPLLLILIGEQPDCGNCAWIVIATNERQSHLLCPSARSIDTTAEPIRSIPRGAHGGCSKAAYSQSHILPLQESPQQHLAPLCRALHQAFRGAAASKGSHTASTRP